MEIEEEMLTLNLAELSIMVQLPQNVLSPYEDTGSQDVKTKISE